MAGKKINYHPDSIDSESRSFILIGLTIVSGLAGILLIFFMLDLGNLGTVEFVYMALILSIPLGLGILAFKGDKEAFAYDRASQIVNYNETIKMTIAKIEPFVHELKIDTELGEQETVEEKRFNVSLQKNESQYNCVVRRRVYVKELSKEKEQEEVAAYIDTNTNEVAAFRLDDNLYWAIPKLVLELGK